MQSHGPDRRATKRIAARWQWLTAAAMAAALIVGCGDDSEQTSPIGPSAIPTAGMDAQTGPQPIGSIGNDGGTSYVTDAAAGTAGRTSSTNGFTTGPLPPGMSIRDIDRRLAERNSWLDGGVRQATFGRPGPVADLTATETVQRGSVSVEWSRPEGTSGSTDYDVEWERLDGGTCGTNCKHVLEFSEFPRPVYIVLPTRLNGAGYYLFWVRVRGTGGRHGPWRVAWTEVTEGTGPPPGPPDPPYGIRFLSDSVETWSCSNSGCAAEPTRVAMRGLLREIVVVQIQGSDNRTNRDFNRSRNISARDSTDVVINMGLPVSQGEYLVRARQRRAQGEWSAWGSSGRVKIEPTPAQAGRSGAVPTVPRNVIVRKTGTRWKLSWDPPTADGWLITKYLYGDTGPRLGRGTPGRTCGGAGWPYRTVNSSSTRSGDEGREHGVVVGIHLPDEWTLSISAVNARGEGSCAAGSRE